MSTIYMAVAPRDGGCGVAVFKSSATMSSSDTTITLGLGRGELLRVGCVLNPAAGHGVGATIAQAMAVRHWFNSGPSVGGACAPEEFIFSDAAHRNHGALLGALVMAWCDPHNDNDAPEAYVDDCVHFVLASPFTVDEVVRVLTQDEVAVQVAGWAPLVLEAVTLGLVHLGRLKRSESIDTYLHRVIATSVTDAQDNFGTNEVPIDLGLVRDPERWTPGMRVWGFRTEPASGTWREAPTKTKAGWVVKTTYADGDVTYSRTYVERDDACVRADAEVSDVSMAHLREVEPASGESAIYQRIGFVPVTKVEVDAIVRSVESERRPAVRAALYAACSSFGDKNYGYGPKSRVAHALAEVVLPAYERGEDLEAACERAQVVPPDRWWIRAMLAAYDAARGST